MGGVHRQGSGPEGLVLVVDLLGDESKVFESLLGALFIGMQFRDFDGALLVVSLLEGFELALLADIDALLLLLVFWCIGGIFIRTIRDV